MGEERCHVSAGLQVSHVYLLLQSSLVPSMDTVLGKSGRGRDYMYSAHYKQVTDGNSTIGNDHNKEVAALDTDHRFSVHVQSPGAQGTVCMSMLAEEMT